MAPAQETSYNAKNLLAAAIYVLSGSAQPIVMRLIKDAGLADPTCQLYMLFFYAGPSILLIPVLFDDAHPRPSGSAALKACGISSWDLVSTALNYSGAALAGPAIFGIVYSSVAIWTAVLSRILVKRRMTSRQWTCVLVVFAGLAWTARDASNARNRGVREGAALVLVGSAMHGLFYVMSERVMTSGEDRLTARQNCAIQNSFAACFFLAWEVSYALPRADERLLRPMRETGTALPVGISFLVLFGATNLIHAAAFYHTLRNFPGGATSAGVMKGLQAVLVFVITDWAFCGRRGGPEMCFTATKLVSLVTVAGGVIGYGIATEEDDKGKDGYERIESINELTELPHSPVPASRSGRDEENGR